MSRKPRKKLPPGQRGENCVSYSCMPVTNTAGKKAQLKQSGGVMVRGPGIWEAEAAGSPEVGRAYAAH